LGHAPNHAPDVFRFLNLETRHVITSCNVVCLNQMYGDWKKLNPEDIEYVVDDDEDDDYDADPGREEEENGGDDGEIEVENQEEEEQTNQTPPPPPQ
jgi:hypothetical protein